MSAGRRGRREPPITKVLLVIGTRPEAIKMASVVLELRQRPHAFECKVCLSGQHREMLDQTMALWGIRADHDLDIMRSSQSLTDVTTSVLEGLAPVIAGERPDWLLVQGDTTTALAGSLAAFYHRVPVGHVEAGLRTGDSSDPYPEEMNRRLTGVLANRHFAPTEWAAGNLRREGVADGDIFVTGNTVIDAFRLVTEMPLDPTVLPAGLPIGQKRIVVVTAHRRENIGSGIESICSAVKAIAESRDDTHVVWPVHPNPAVHGPVHAELGGVRNVSLLPPLDYQPLVWLLNHCHFLMTDSGGLQEEATGIAKPVLVLRETTERPEGIDAGTAKLVGTNPHRILLWAEMLLSHEAAYLAMSRATSPYGIGRAAKAIADALLPAGSTADVDPSRPQRSLVTTTGGSDP